MSLSPDVLAAIANASAATGTPSALLEAQILQESGGDQNAVGAAGELGAMQLMPSTAAALGVDPTDLNDNVLGGATYDAQLYAQYGSWDQALAAYNAGPGTVNNALATYGASGWTAGVPASSVNYSTNILAGSGLAATSSAPGGISTPSTLIGDLSSVSSTVSNFSTWEIAAGVAAIVLIVWRLS